MDPHPVTLLRQLPESPGRKTVWRLGHKRSVGESWVEDGAAIACPLCALWPPGEKAPSWTPRLSEGSHPRPSHCPFLGQRAAQCREGPVSSSTPWLLCLSQSPCMCYTSKQPVLLESAPQEGRDNPPTGPQHSASQHPAQRQSPSLG